MRINNILLLLSALLTPSIAIPLPGTVLTAILSGEKRAESASPPGQYGAYGAVDDYKTSKRAESASATGQYGAYGADDDYSIDKRAESANPPGQYGAYGAVDDYKTDKTAKRA